MLHKNWEAHSNKIVPNIFFYDWRHENTLSWKKNSMSYNIGTTLQTIILLLYGNTIILHFLKFKISFLFIPII